MKHSPFEYLKYKLITRPQASEEVNSSHHDLTKWLWEWIKCEKRSVLEIWWHLEHWREVTWVLRKDNHPFRKRSSWNPQSSGQECSKQQATNKWGKLSQPRKLSQRGARSWLYPTRLKAYFRSGFSWQAEAQAGNCCFGPRCVKGSTFSYVEKTKATQVAGSPPDELQQSKESQTFEAELGK